MVPGLSIKTIILTLFIIFSCVEAQSLSLEARSLILETVVQIIPWDNEANELAPWSGSGTIISPEGHIITNYHIIGDSESQKTFEWHAIFMSKPSAIDQLPEIAYWARYVKGDPIHDLAVLKIEEYPDESPIPKNVIFPALPIGDSDALFPGDVITIIGYPGISGPTITFTGGLMSGWVGEDLQSGGKQWVKTDAKIARGNTGGTVVNSKGELIGIPTAATYNIEGNLYEEQLYIRPIRLALALITPTQCTVACQ